MTCKQIVFEKAYDAELSDMPVPAVGAHDVKVKTYVSTVSCGTERANLIGDPNVSINGSSNVSFPRFSGYNSTGVVVEKGNDVSGIEIGDRVLVFWGFHKEYNVVNEQQVVKLPDSVSFEEGAMSFIATFPMAAIRKTRLEIGESAVVMGLGILGMLAVKLLKAAGAVPIIAADPNPDRRETALENGADYAFDPTLPDFAEQVKKVTDGGVNIAIEATGVGAGFNEALDCMAKFGRVALLGCTRNSDFTVDYYRKIHAPGITVIGAHTMARPEKESHPGWFTHRDDIKAMFRLISGKRIDISRLVEETHTPHDCHEIYDRLANDKKFPVVVQFDWRNMR